MLVLKIQIFRDVMQCRLVNTDVSEQPSASVFTVRRSMLDVQNHEDGSSILLLKSVTITN
jgi:hypothetical protein